MSSCGLIDDKTGNDIPSTGMNNMGSQDGTRTLSKTFAGISSTPMKLAFGTVSSIGSGAKSIGFTSPFQPQSRQDGSNNMLHSITAMPPYENKSFGELRPEDYRQGIKGSATAAPTSAFGSQPTALGGGLFGAPAPAPVGNGLFGATSNTGASGASTPVLTTGGEERRVWECDIGGDWIQYPSYVNDLLKKKFLSGGGQVKFVLYDTSNEYEINLNSFAAPIVQLNTKTRVKRSVRSIIKQYTTLSNGVPATWLPHDAGENCKMVGLCNSSKEWDYVEKMLSSDLPNAKLIKVERVQNINLWNYFCFRREEARKLSGETDIKSVWHGTRYTDPMCICNDKKDGFMMQHSRKGKWGCGIYFAAKASYSNQYAYMGRQKPPSTLSHQKKQTKSLILAKLVVGDAVFLKPDSTLRFCPHKNKGQGRYDTVTGVTGGSKIYVVYENGRAYPEYLVTYM